MNEAAYRRIIETNESITRRTKYTDFNIDQLKEIRQLYLKKGYLNVAETAVLLGVHYNSVYKLIEKGKVILKKDSIHIKPYLIDVNKTLNHVEVSI